MGYSTYWAEANYVRETVSVYTAADANSTLHPDEPVAAGRHGLAFDLDGGSAAVIEGTRDELRAAMLAALDAIDAAPDNDPDYRPEHDPNYS